MVGHGPRPRIKGTEVEFRNHKMANGNPVMFQFLIDFTKEIWGFAI